MKIKKYLLIFLCAAASILILSGCGAKINVETREASGITDTNAFVNGYIDGYEDMPGRVGIYFGTDADNMERVIQDKHPNNKYTSETIDVTYDLNIEAEEILEPETTYYYAFYATVDGKDIIGETKSFTTVASDAVPAADVGVTTGDAKDVTDTNATLYAHISAPDGKPDEAGMYLGKSEDSLKKIARDLNPLKNYDDSEFDVWYNVTSEGLETLEPGTTYYYQAYVRKGNAVTRGEVKSFTTAEDTSGDESDDNAE